MANRLVLSYDIVSPWSYVAFVNLSKYIQLWGDVEFELNPINLGYVMKNSGNKPPISVPNKGQWMGKEMKTVKQFFGVTLNQPKDFPFNSFSIQCLLRVLKESHPDKLHSATDYFYRRVWVENCPDIVSPEGILKEVKAWGELNESEVGKVMEEAGKKETRKMLNDEAVKLVEEGGAFGAPWIVTTRASDQKTVSWFGSDRTEMIAAFFEKPYKGPMADGRASAAKL